MIDIRPIPIILTSFYCFLLGLFFFSVSSSAIFSNGGISDPVIWVPVIAAIIIAALIIGAGIGILYYNQTCWKILFFFLVIFITNITSLIIVLVTCLWLDTSLFYKYYQSIHVSIFMWMSLLFIFLSGIIVIYYLTSREILSYFGDMGELVEPF